MKSALNRANDKRLPRVPRSDFQHWCLEKSIADLCLQNKYKPLTDRYIDLLCNVGRISVIFEVKASPLHDIASPVRRAVIQLLEYRYLYRNSLKPSVRLCIVSERRPRGGYEWITGYLEHLGIGLIWRNDGDDDLNCTEFAKELLGDLFPQVRGWEPRAIMWK